MSNTRSLYNKLQELLNFSHANLNVTIDELANRIYRSKSEQFTYFTSGKRKGQSIKKRVSPDGIKKTIRFSITLGLLIETSNRKGSHPSLSVSDNSASAVDNVDEFPRVIQQRVLFILQKHGDTFAVIRTKLLEKLLYKRILPIEQKIWEIVSTELPKEFFLKCLRLLGDCKALKPFKETLYLPPEYVNDLKTVSEDNA